MNPSALKSRLRQQMRQQRQALTDEQRQVSADLALSVFKQHCTSDLFPMGVYLAFDGELDPQPIITYCWAQDLAVYLPIVVPGEYELTFARYTSETPLVANQYGIMQPQVENTVRADTLRSLLMPLTAFDRQGGRLGMGGGYYDRTLAACADKPTLIGLAYDFQQVAQCPAEAHDEQIGTVLTESTWQNF